MPKDNRRQLALIHRRDTGSPRRASCTRLRATVTGKRHGDVEVHVGIKPLAATDARVQRCLT